MSKGVFLAVCGALAVSAMLALPAMAADDIESKVAICGACHGANGVPTSPATPVIWGQQANYLYKELHDYHSGDRYNAIMSPMAKNFSLEDLRNVANYFAAKKWPTSAAGNVGTPPKSIEMCKACHQPSFEGGAPAPRLAGQNYDYLLTSMRSFANGQRTNNGDMPGFMKALTDSDIEAIAHYLSGQ